MERVEEGRIQQQQAHSFGLYSSSGFSLALGLSAVLEASFYPASYLGIWFLNFRDESYIWVARI